MNSLVGLMRSRINKDRELRVFDWKKAAEIIVREKPEFAGAGLEGDWAATCGMIYTDGEIVLDTDTYLASNWATPQLFINGDYIDCYIMSSQTEWNAHTRWPEEARKILGV